MRAVVEFLSVFLLGIVSGVSLSHLLQRGPKAALPGPQFLAAQQVLLRNYGPAIGGLEVAGLSFTLAMAIVTRGEGVVPLLAILASSCVLLMMIMSLHVTPEAGPGVAWQLVRRFKTGSPATARERRRLIWVFSGRRIGEA